MTTRAGLFGEMGEAIPLRGLDVRADVVAGHACATIRQRYQNDEKKAVEAIYTFPLPTKAILTGFSMTVEGRRIEGEVHERDEAFQRYDDAITAGHGAALLEQERPNVFTANVGNLLPGEETIIEIQYVEPVAADEGAVRWSIPTLVAPRYVPGIPHGDRTAHGTVDPTDRVPDADRISPPIGNDIPYGLKLELTFDLGVAVDVESPSHAIVSRGEGKKTVVTFSQRDVALDRDVVVTAYPKSMSDTSFPIASAVTHRTSGQPGTLALTIVPDLGALSKQAHGTRSEVVFLLDRSGSMGGPSIEEARTALRLCLRQLREGDRFGILAFDDTVEAFARELVPFTQATLQRADQWLASIGARGGTELREPMVQACKLAPDGVIILLTDGQVANEDEIKAAVMKARVHARVYSFGIGTNVSDALLHALAEETAGAVEMIHPGERVDEKVIAQFARATAARVTEVTIKARGISLGEMAPATPPSLVDGEPYSLFATYEEPGRGVLEIRGKRDGEAFYLEVPVDLEAQSDRPVVTKLWAQARIRDLERVTLEGRRADAMKDRIVRLATTYGVSSKYTSFVVVEKRTGDRRVNEQATTRVVPVNAPADWTMFSARRGRHAAGVPAAGAPAAARGRSYAMSRSLGAGRREPITGAAPAMRPPSAPMGAIFPLDGIPRDFDEATRAPTKMKAVAKNEAFRSPPPPPPLPAPRPASMGAFVRAPECEDEPMDTGAGRDPVLDLLAMQSASGLWEEPGRDTVDVMADVLLQLLRLGLSTSHPVHGAQIKKAIEAFVAHVVQRGDAPSLALALGVAWLLSSGRRTRQSIEEVARRSGSLAPLVATFGDEKAVRQHVDTIAR